MLRKILISLFIALWVCSITHAAEIYFTPGQLPDPNNPHNMSSTSNAGANTVTVGAVNFVRELHKAESPSAGGTDQICIFCHTPHSAAAKTPLWGRPDPDGPNGDGTFPVYAQSLGIKNSAILTGYTTSNPEYPSGASRMCLSCHDGVTSIGVLLGGETIVMAGGNTITSGDLTVNAVIDLTTSHPISFLYNQDVVDAIDVSNTEYQVPNVAIVNTPLDGEGKMQCTTCHDPHYDTRPLGTYGNLPFWRHQNGASSYGDVCNACHKTPPSSSSLPHTLP